MDAVNAQVTGEIGLRLYKGSVRVVTRSSPNAVYDAELASFYAVRRALLADRLAGLHRALVAAVADGAPAARERRDDGWSASASPRYCARYARDPDRDRRRAGRVGLATSLCALSSTGRGNAGCAASLDASWRRLGSERISSPWPAPGRCLGALRGAGPGARAGGERGRSRRAGSEAERRARRSGRAGRRAAGEPGRTGRAPKRKRRRPKGTRNGSPACSPKAKNARRS